MPMDGISATELTTMASPLHGRGYIAPVARDNGPGQAVMWGTTQLFLEKLGLASLADMPPIATFVPDASLVEALEKTLRIEAEPLSASESVEDSEPVAEEPAEPSESS
jgi:segregation and condensation protein B